MLPNKGLNQCPQQWQLGVLTTGLPGKSPGFLFKGAENILNLFIYLFIGCAGSLLLHAGFSLVVASWGYSVVVRGLLIAVASLVVEHGL